MNEFVHLYVGGADTGGGGGEVGMVLNKHLCSTKVRSLGLKTEAGMGNRETKCEDSLLSNRGF